VSLCVRTYPLAGRPVPDAVVVVIVLLAVVLTLTGTGAVLLG
jgi:hypothetical protein